MFGPPALLIAVNWSGFSFGERRVGFPYLELKNPTFNRKRHIPAHDKLTSKRT
jgi:hypothetical protein